MINNKYICERCGDHLNMSGVCGCTEFQIIDEDSDEYKVFAHCHRSAAEKHVRSVLYDGLIESIMHDHASFTVTGQGETKELQIKGRTSLEFDITEEKEKGKEQFWENYKKEQEHWSEING